MILKSERLVIRDFLPSDWDALHQLYMLPETVKYNPSGYPDSEEVTKRLVGEWSAQKDLPARRSYTLVITGVDNDFIGIISLDMRKEKYKDAEVWFKLHPSKWNKGFATESLKMMLKLGFETLGLHRIEGGCSVHNTASYLVMEKVGMTREGTRRQHLPLDDGWHDGYLYSILRDEFDAKH